MEQVGAAHPEGLARRGVRALVADAPASVWLGALVAVSALLRFLAALAAPAPWIFPDEWIYAELARSFSDSGSFAVWGVPWPVRGTGPLYPILLSPAYALTGSLEQTYLVVKAVNAVLMSLAAVPAYVLARRLVPHALAFFAAVLTLLAPAMVYTSKVMTENVAYPLFLFAALAIVRVLERPTGGRQAVALTLLALSVLVRTQMLVLVPIYASALVLVALLDSRAEGTVVRPGSLLRRLSVYRTTWITAAAGILVLVVGLSASGRSPFSLFGAYEHLPELVRPLATPRWLLYQLAELDLAVGVVPLAAFFIVAVLTWRQTILGRPMRVFVSLAVSAFAWFLLLGAVYATQPRATPHVFERYVFYVMPLLFVSLVVWLDRGLPRPRPWGYVAAGLAFALPATLPYGTLLNGREWGVSSSTPGLVPWATLREALGTGWPMMCAVLAATALLALVFLRTRPERESFVRFVSLTALWMITLVVGVSNISAAKLAAQRAGDDPGWVDASVGRDAEGVAAVWPGRARRDEAGLYAVLETQFFNRSVNRVYHVGSPIKPGVPSQPLPVETPDDVFYVVADGPTTPLFSLVRRQPDGPLAVFRVHPDGE